KTQQFFAGLSHGDRDPRVRKLLAYRPERRQTHHDVSKLAKIDDEYVARIEHHPCYPWLKFSQIAARHLSWLLEPEQTEQRGRDVFERAACSQLRADRLFIDQMKRHGVRCVRRVWAAGGRIDHLLGVAMIGGDQRDAIRGAHSLCDPTETGVY